MSLTILIVLLSATGCFCGVINAPGSGYTRWPNKVILYRYSGASATENDLLGQAMEQISIDVGRCINFTTYNPSIHQGQPFLAIQNKFTNPATANDMCWTYPGYTPSAGANGQAVVMFSVATGSNTAGGCLDSKRDAMRVIMNAIGVLNEYRRSDRDSYITFPTSTDRNTLVASLLQKYNIFATSSIYPTSTASLATATMDLNSVTMVNGPKFAGTSTPVFTASNGATIGQLARLSKSDCDTLRLVYNCDPGGYGPVPNCIDPYASSSGITFIPNPAVISRTIQCPVTASSALVNPYVIATFQISGLPYVANSATPPTLTYLPAVTGLSVALKTASTPLWVTPATGRLDTSCTPTSCTYLAEFTMNVQLSKGLLNQQITVNVVQNSATIASIAVTLNLNCAPQFTAATAFLVGPAAALANQVTKSYGTAAGSLQQLSNPATPVGAVLSTTTAAILAPFMATYLVEFGNTGVVPTTTALATSGAGTRVDKLFVNCMTAAAGPSPSAATTLPAGTTVLGQISAVDPEGGSVSFSVYTVHPIAGSTITATGEQYTITDDGVLSMAAPSPPISNAAASGGLPDTNSAAVELAALQTSDTVPRSVQIMAVDSNGGQSVLEFRFYPQCGIVQA